MGAPAFHDYLEGTNGRDTFDLTSKPYSFFGYTKSGLGYFLEMGDGDDLAYGTQSNDWIDGQGHDDTIYANDGDDDLYGGGGDDDLFAGPGHDDLFGGDGADTLEGNGGNDDLDGGAGNDTLHGDNNVLGVPQGGNPGNDSLFGGSGEDQLFGQDGNDTLRGGTDRDVLTGGAGADTFRFAASDLQVVTWEVFPRMYARMNWSLDTIKDFGAAEGDILDVAEVLDVYTSFAGATATEAINQGYIYWIQHGTVGQPGFGTTVYVDVNGTAANVGRSLPFALAYLEGVPSSDLTAAQFDVVV
jgi:Ca2+-binding RTX toxin-like protein